MRPADFTADQAAALVQAINAGQTVTAAAQQFGTSRAAIYRAVARHGLRFDSRRAVESLRETVLNMPALEAVNLLLDLVEASIPEHAPENIMRFRQFGFSNQQARILCVLWDATPKMVSLDTLCMRMGGRDDGGNIESLRVQIVNARKRLRQIGWPVEITNSRGAGYALLVTEPGWTGPL